MIDIEAFRATECTEGLITAVLFGTQIQTMDSEADDVPSNVFFNMVVKTKGGLVPLSGVQTACPVPADDYLLWGARPKTYVGKVVPVLRNQAGFFPLIPWMPATEVCDDDSTGGGDPPDPPEPPNVDGTETGGSVSGDTDGVLNV